MTKDPRTASPPERIATYISWFSPDASRAFCIQTGLEENRSLKAKNRVSHILKYLRRTGDNGIVRLLEIHPDLEILKRKCAIEDLQEVGFSDTNALPELAQYNQAIAFAITHKPRQLHAILRQYYNQQNTEKLNDTELVRLIYQLVKAYPMRQHLIFGLSESRFDGEADFNPALATAGLDAAGKAISGGFDLLKGAQAAKAQGRQNIADANSAIMALRAAKLNADLANKNAQNQTNKVLIISGAALFGVCVLGLIIFLIMRKK